MDLSTYVVVAISAIVKVKTYQHDGLMEALLFFPSNYGHFIKDYENDPGFAELVDMYKTNILEYFISIPIEHRKYFKPLLCS